MRGGKREGAGRKPKPDKKKPVSFRLHPKLIERLKREENQASAIEKALCRWFGIDLDEQETEKEGKAMKIVRINEIILRANTYPTYFVDYKIGKDCWKNYGSSCVYAAALEMKKQINSGEIVL